MRLPLTSRLLLVIATAVGMLAPAATGALAATDPATQMVSLINAERRDAGLAALASHDVLVVVAGDWSRRMAAANTLSHRPDLGQVVLGDWTRLGENVGRGAGISSLHDAFMASPGHRANVLGDFQTVGVAVVSQDGRLWVTINFAKGTVSGTTIKATSTSTKTAAAVPGVFADVAGDATHHPGIAALKDAGITKGCTADRYCPTDTVTRAQMASYVARGMGLATTGTADFSDVASGSTHAGAIAAVSDAGVMTPCASGEFCPEAPVLRDEMARIMGRMLELQPTATTSRFSDVTTAELAGWVEALADANVTNGCSADRYCPSGDVTRAEMATFLARALGLAA